MYDYSTYYDVATSTDTTILASVMAVLATYSVVILGVLIVNIVGQWKMFSKAGQAGWKSIVPILNTITLLKIAGLSPWLILVFLAAIIPGIGGLVVLGFQIFVMYKLATAFGHGIGYTLGLLFLSPIFVCILGFGKSEYQLTTETTTAE